MSARWHRKSSEYRPLASCIFVTLTIDAGIDQIRRIPRPSRVEHDPAKGNQDLIDVLWSDPADSDAVRLEKFEKKILNQQVCFVL